MARAPFQVLVIPYRRAGALFEFAIFGRCDDLSRQFIAGGGEDSEAPLEAAHREAREEACIPTDSRFVRLDTTASVPVTGFEDSRLWGESVYVIPEYCFGVDCTGHDIAVSYEHTEFRWLPFQEASRILTYDSNRTALWELNQKLHSLGPRATWPNHATELTGSAGSSSCFPKIGFDT